MKVYNYLVAIPEDGAVMELNGSVYYFIQTYLESDDGSEVRTAGYFCVNVMTGEVYALDFATNQLAPLKNTIFIDKDSNEYEKHKNDVLLMLPEQERISVFHFVERDGREYYVFKMVDKETVDFRNQYYYYDLLTKELFTWDLEKDTLEKVKKGG